LIYGVGGAREAGGQPLRAERGRVFRRKWLEKGREIIGGKREAGGWGREVVVEVGRVEHGEDTVERIRVVEGRGKIERGSKEREKEGVGVGREGGAGERMATSMLEKHRVALRARIPSRSRGILFSRAAEGRNCRSAKEIVEKNFFLLSRAT